MVEQAHTEETGAGCREYTRIAQRLKKGKKWER